MVLRLRWIHVGIYRQMMLTEECVLEVNWVLESASSIMFEEKMHCLEIDMVYVYIKRNAVLWVWFFCGSSTDYSIQSKTQSAPIQRCYAWLKHNCDSFGKHKIHNSVQSRTDPLTARRSFPFLKQALLKIHPASLYFHFWLYVLYSFSQCFITTLVCVCILRHTSENIVLA